jgi:DNA-binding SARP family transcriptional activator/tetratricopeptide (TPR) repeat protein
MVPRGKIATLLWAEQSEDAARHALRQCLLDLRQVLATAKLEALRAEADLIGLEPSRVVVDAARFESQIAHGTPEALQAAVALYRGDLLEGFSLKEPAFEDWLRVERERLRSKSVGALKKLLAHHVRQRGPDSVDSAVQVAVRLLALEPFDETVHRALMRLYAESGRRSAALRQYEDCVELLGRELGVEPESETRELYRKLVAERARPTKVQAAHPSPIFGDSKTRIPFGSSARTPLVGREDDLGWLDGLRQGTRRGHPALVLVVGEAGIGKSRLVAEVAVRAQSQRTEILLGRGREGESVLPFAPWVEALRPVLSQDLVGRLPPVVRRDLARLCPEIADGPRPPPGGLEDGTRIFEAIAQVLRQLATAHPVMIVIEDLHWCDDMTVRLLRFLPRRLEGRAVCLVGTARPEEVGGDAVRRRLLETLYRDTTCVSRTLAPLSRDETTQLFRALLASRVVALPTSLDERMWRLSEGNPFVVVECARAVRDRDAAGPDVSLGLPDQVRALTERCFKELSDRGARLADAAAVVGRDVDVVVLRHATRLTEPQVVDCVEELVRRHVLREVDGRFDFVHDRVREVAYARLLGPRRALLHRQVAEALEAVYAADLDPHCAAIGVHYREAGVWEHSTTFLARAGFQAFERGACREALACFESALQAMPRLPDTEPWRELQVRMRLICNDASKATGSYERGHDYLIEAEKVAVSLTDRRWEGRVACALGSGVRAAGALDRALMYGSRALSIAEETKDRQLESTARFLLAMAENNVGHFRLSLEHLSKILALSALPPDGDDGYLPFIIIPFGTPRNVARFWKVNGHTQLGEFDAGVRLVEEWLRDEDMSDESVRAPALLAHISLGRVQNGAGRFAEAIRAYERALALYREDAHGAYHTPLMWGLGLAYALGGRVGDGLEVLGRAEEAVRKLGSKSFGPMRLLHSGRVLIEAGRIEEADRNGAEALAVAIKDGNRISEAGAHGLLAEIAKLREPVDEAVMRRHLIASLELAEAMEARPLAARCHLRLAWLYDRVGRGDGARHAAAAGALMEMMGEPASLAAAGVH